MKEIILSKGMVALVDDEDFDELNKFKWFAEKSDNTYYAGRNDYTRKNKHVKMHREITSAPLGKVVDHINHNGLDNRKENLRICSHAENCRNTNSKGYYFNKQKRRWHALLRLNGKHIHLGFFKTELEASLARIAGEKRHFGEFASTRTTIQNWIINMESVA
jgi:hypothetical protein